MNNQERISKKTNLNSSLHLPEEKNSRKQYEAKGNKI